MGIYIYKHIYTCKRYTNVYTYIISVQEYLGIVFKKLCFNNELSY